MLRAERDQRGIFGGKGEGFVHGIGVQRLAAAQHCRKRLDGHAHDIVLRLLRGQRRAGGLRVEAQKQGARIFCGEALLHNFGPEAASGAELGDFFEEIAVGVKEEGKLRSEIVNGESGVESGLDVGNAIGEGEGDFLDGRGAGFANVVARDGNGIPFGKFAAAPGENIGDDAHCRADGIDVGAASDVFLEDVVLNGARKFGEIGALFFCDGDVETEKDRGGGVDSHGSGDALERDLIEERFHVFQGIDGDADFADFSEGQGMIGVHADLRWKIERYGEALLSFAEQIAIALIGFCGATEAGVLTHGPETPTIHGGINAAGVGEFAGKTG